jgi:hypothetical protein
MKLAFCAALGAIVSVLGVGCGSSDDCIILANGGNKLCGDDAAAWCNSTDALRDVAGEISDRRLAEANANSQAACDEIRNVSTKVEEPTPTSPKPTPAEATRRRTPLPAVDLHIYQRIVGATSDDLSIAGLGMLYETRRPTLTIDGKVDPPTSNVRILRRKSGGGWNPATSIQVRRGEFSTRVQLRRGDNDFKIVAKADGRRTEDVLIGIHRR